jgi:hypothetical protein
MKIGTFSTLAMVGMFLILLSVAVSAGVNNVFARTTSYFLVRCGVFTDSTSCEDSGCYWWGGVCNTMPSAPGAVETDYCLSIEDGIQLCITTANTKYILVDVGMYQEAIQI